MLHKTAGLSLFLLCAAMGFAQSKSRHFIFEYTFTVQNTNPGKPIQIWFPRAQSDPYQRVTVVSKTGDLPLQETREGEYGNSIFYAHAERADRPEYRFRVMYDVVRYEQLSTGSARAGATQWELQRFLSPDRLVPVTGRPAEIAAQRVNLLMSEMEKARTLYEFTFGDMHYDKSGSGWGNGDALWACDSKRGNCTDFHSLFISMVRSQHIPAKFEIGFPLPEDEGSAAIAGYHCWAEFYVSQRGWIPVDISEAWKHREKKEYFFGATDANRILFTVGRDLEMNPRQHGERLNYFIYPYVEVDGKPYGNISKSFSFTDVRTVQRATR